MENVLGYPELTQEIGVSNQIKRAINTNIILAINYAGGGGPLAEAVLPGLDHRLSWPTRCQEPVERQLPPQSEAPDAHVLEQGPQQRLDLQGVVDVLVGH